MTDLPLVGKVHRYIGCELDQLKAFIGDEAVVVKGEESTAVWTADILRAELYFPHTFKPFASSSFLDGAGIYVKPKSSAQRRMSQGTRRLTDCLYQTFETFISSKVLKDSLRYERHRDDWFRWGDERVAEEMNKEPVDYQLHLMDLYAQIPITYREPLLSIAASIAKSTHMFRVYEELSGQGRETRVFDCALVQR